MMTDMSLAAAQSLLPGRDCQLTELSVAGVKRLDHRLNLVSGVLKANGGEIIDVDPLLPGQ